MLGDGLGPAGLVISGDHWFRRNLGRVDDGGPGLSSFVVHTGARPWPPGGFGGHSRDLLEKNVEPEMTDV